MPAKPSLQRFVEDELDRSAALAPQLVADISQQLRNPREQVPEAERRQYNDLWNALQRNAAEFQKSYSDTLRSRVTAELAGQELAFAAAGGAAAAWTLVDESRVEEDIEVSSAQQLIESHCEWELRELQTFTSALAGQPHVSAESNPLRPLMYVSALWQATAAVTPAAALRAGLLRVAARVLAGQLKLAWAAACSRLEAQGVEPSQYRTVVFAPGTPGLRERSVDVTSPGALGELLARMPAGPGTAGAGAATPGLPVTPALQLALDQLERRLGSGGMANAAAPGPASPAERGALLAEAGGLFERQVIELLSRLFDAMLSDPRLEASFRGVMARLQVSVLRVALQDPAMIASHRHPVWRLMNRIGLAAQSYPHENDPRRDELLTFCEVMVDRMARAPVQDAALYRDSLARLDGVLAEQLRRQQDQAGAAIENLTAAEQRENRERQLGQKLVEEMRQIRTTPAIRRFVTTTWAKVLAEAMQRFGEEAPQTTGYVRAADELLWSLRLPDHPQSRQRLVSLLPGLLQRLRSGMALISLPVAEQQQVLNALMEVHTVALRPAKDVPEPTSAEIVQRLRDEVIPDSAPATFSDSLIDLFSMDTVPADAIPTEAVSEPAARQVEAMAPGRFYRLFLQGRWNRVQLLWRSLRGEFLLFAAEAPGRTHSVTRRALERLAGEGLVKPLEDRSVVQRAVDHLTRSLESAPPAA